MDYFTSDTHYGHARVIEYSKRPFKSVEEMDEALIANHNSVVKPGDRVFHLGDFAFAKEDRILSILKQLNGQKYLCFGNHDKEMRRSEKIKGMFVKVGDYLEIDVKDANGDKQRIVLCHYPMITWNKAHHESWMLHGHCHGNLKYPFDGKILDVGVDPMGYFPRSFDEIKSMMSSKGFTALDHHLAD
jgi:calcineurin-like phosphoesterase family protein